MTDAPDRMFVFPKNGDWFNAGASTHKIVGAGAKDVEYIRADQAKAPVTVQEAARVLRDAPELMEGWSEDGWADIFALAEQEGPSTPPRDGVE